MKSRISIVILLFFCAIGLIPCTNTKINIDNNSKQVDKIDKRIFQVQILNPNNVNLNNNKRMEIIMVNDDKNINEDYSLEVMEIPKGKSINNLYNDYINIASNFDFLDKDETFIKLSINENEFERISQSFVLIHSEQNYKGVLVVYE